MSPDQAKKEKEEVIQRLTSNKANTQIQTAWLLSSGLNPCMSQKHGFQNFVKKHLEIKFCIVRKCKVPAVSSNKSLMKFP